MAADDPRARTYIGDVVRRTFARGSKSERPAVMLSTPYGDFTIRRDTGGRAADRELEALVGKRIRASGIRHRHLFVLQTWEEIKRRRTR